jgi:hypothetical protein
MDVTVSMILVMLTMMMVLYPLHFTSYGKDLRKGKYKTALKMQRAVVT